MPPPNSPKDSSLFLPSLVDDGDTADDLCHLIGPPGQPGMDLGHHPQIGFGTLIIVDSVRKDIINSSDWIKEIGDEKMQDMYLRGKCLFKLFVSTETIVSSEAIINKFECEDDE